MAAPIGFVNNSESSDEAFSDSESSYSSEDESMEDEPSGNINGGGGSLTSIKREETDRDRTEEEEFWVRYPYLKNFLVAIVARGLVPGNFVFERAKLIGDEKAKELNDRCKALSNKELELCKMKCDLVASAITAMKSAN